MMPPRPVQKCNDATEAGNAYIMMANREGDLTMNLWTSSRREGQMFRRYRRSIGRGHSWRT